MKPRTYPKRSRKQSPHVTDGRIDTILPPGTLRELLKTFEKDVCRRPRCLPAGLTPCERAYFRFLFSLIVYTGIAGPDGWEEITSLRFSHLAMAHSGFLAIPRKGGEVPVALPPIVQACAASLGLHLLRSRSRSHRFLAPYPADGFLIPGRSDPSAKPDAQELIAVRSRFLLWLDDLSATLHRNITFNQLCDLARMRLADHGHPIVSGTLLGLHLSNPIPVDQYSSVQKLADRPADRDGISIQPGELEKEYHPRLGIWKTTRGGPVPNYMQTGTDWDRTAAPLRKLVRPYTRADKRKARLLRPSIQSRLARFVRDGGRCSGKRDDESWSEFTKRVPAGMDVSRWWNINILLLADWMASLIRGYPPNTVKDRFSDLIQIFRILPGVLYGGMDQPVILDRLFGLRISTSSLARLADSLHAFTVYLHAKHGFKLLELPWWLLRGRRVLREQRILIDEDVSTLLARFPTAEPMDFAMRCGILLIRYFGLRLSELVGLRICDVWLKGRPTVFVWNSKGGGSRWIECGEIPRNVVDYLQEYFSRRVDASGNNPTALLLVRPNGKPVTRGMFDRRMRKAIRRTGISAPGGGDSLATHGLRHTCANNWWLGNLPIVEVARRLGHKSLDTTIPYYIHTQPVKQLSSLKPLYGKAAVTKVSVSAMAVLNGITRRAVYYRKNPSNTAASVRGVPQSSEFQSILNDFCACRS